MASTTWQTKHYSIQNLHLDPKNPRLGREITARAPREILQYLFDFDKALEVAESIALRGFFPNEPLLAIQEKGQMIVVEGNRRLAALKALNEPGLLEGSYQRKIERLARKIKKIESIQKVPVTIAPNRKSTDKQIAGRHIGTPVLAWLSENRASFILDKLSEGYTNDQLRDELGFKLKDIQAARQTRAIADMARSIDLPDEIKAKIDNPRVKLFSTLERIFDSSVGRDFFKIEPDADNGFRGKTTKDEFLKGFTKLVSDLVLGNEDSRTLNTTENMQAYFKKWKPSEIPKRKRGKFLPSDIIEGKTVAAIGGAQTQTQRQPTAKAQQTVLPKSFKIVNGNERLIDIRKELVKMRTEDYPNAGAVLLRVFFELASTHYLEQTGKLEELKKSLKTKGKLPKGELTLKQMIPSLIKVAKDKLSERKAEVVEKAITYNTSAPFSISELHGFVHSSDFPGSRDIQQFWNRVEPLMSLMLGQEIVSEEK